MYLVQACHILELVQASGASHIHAHFGTNPAEVAMLVRLLGGPGYSFTVHGPEEFDKGQVLGLDRKIARAKFVLAISDYGRA
ncbi:colanic acid biosynthesis glycosyltransferase WcaL, partial [Microbacteriaceae bacterium K1510]|nr:colanic acid biosynthesis glycosyltransferase WcaL [Microbacteriaceae bacterium K1510]